MTDDMVSKITPSILNKKPNTYTFTKAMAEHMVITEGVGLPINIVRPSIVGATWKEPFPVSRYSCDIIINYMHTVSRDIHIDSVPIKNTKTKLMAFARKSTGRRGEVKGKTKC